MNQPELPLLAADRQPAHPKRPSSKGLRTLMDSGLCETHRLVFELIYSGIDSFIARRIWDRK